MRRFGIFLLTGFFVVLPFISEAAGLVPCGGRGEQECQACDVGRLANNVLQWMIQIMSSIIALVFIYGGIKMVMSAGNPGDVTSAKKMMTNSVIGFIILLGSFLIINTVIRTLTGTERVSGTPWYEIACVKQPEFKSLPANTSRPVVGGGTNPSISANDVDARIAATNKYKDDLCRLAKQNNIENQCAALQAIMSIESAGDPNAQSAYASGLMQLTPETAKYLDEKYNLGLGYKGLPNSVVGEKIKDPNINMELGVRYYAELYNQFKNKGTASLSAEDLAAAAYNGGPGANAASRDCEGALAWQCEWDDRDHTIPDTADGKSFKETRSYVPNTRKVREKLGG